MKTSIISQRVADFLKSYPPFEFMDESDLLALAMNGRVHFHESDEIIFSAGDDRTDRFYVVQQGTVKLFKRAEQSEELIDVRVEGDLLGVFWIVQAERYMHSARTSSDTILYAFNTEQFKAIAKRNSQVNRYLAAYFSMHPGHDTVASTRNPSVAVATHGLASDDVLAMTGKALSDEVHMPLLTCTPEQKIYEITTQLGCHAAYVVINHDKHPVGVMDEIELLNYVATGRVPASAPVEAVMNKDFATIPPSLSIGDILIEMLHQRYPYLCITKDGTRDTPVLGVIGNRQLQLYCGRLATPLTQEIMLAQTPEHLARLRKLVDELLHYYLNHGISIDWVANFLAASENTLVERLIQIAQEVLVGEGLEDPDIPFVWLAMHAEGRKERVLRSAQRTGLLFADPPPEKFKICQAWFLALGEKVTKLLEQCGLPRSAKGLMANDPQWCLPLSQWKALFSKWISDPVASDIIRLTPFFDLRVVTGDGGLATALRTHIYTELQAHPNFMPLLASDAMDNLPPVTIFRNSVMDKSGVLWTSIDTKLHAMLPLVDVARVFALKYGLLTYTSTIERFEQIADVLSADCSLFKEAAQAMRTTLSLQSYIGLSRGDNGQYIRAAELSKIDQQDFKNVFRTIIQLLEYTAVHFKNFDAEPA